MSKNLVNTLLHIAAFDYVCKAIVLYTTSGGVFTISFASVIGAPV